MRLLLLALLAAPASADVAFAPYNGAFWVQFGLDAVSPDGKPMPELFEQLQLGCSEEGECSLVHLGWFPRRKESSQCQLRTTLASTRDGTLVMLARELPAGKLEFEWKELPFRRRATMTLREDKGLAVATSFKAVQLIPEGRTPSDFEPPFDMVLPAKGHAFAGKCSLYVSGIQ